MKDPLSSFVATLMSLMLALVSYGSAQSTTSTISVNPDIKYQTFRGWEVAILPTVLDYRDWLPGFDDLFRQAAQDLGITRLQVAIVSGMEHPPGYAARYLKGEIPEREIIRAYFYNVINDNRNENRADLTKFEFGLLDWQMDHMVVPYKRHLEAAGHKLELNLSYVDFGKSAFEHYNEPDEYAEFMLVMFDHLKKAYGIVPDAINVVNEPDQTPWTGARMGRAIVSTATRLAAAGYHPEFIAPSTVNRASAVAFYDDIVRVPGAAALVKELSFHCYRDTGKDSLQAIATRARQAGIATSQNECWGPQNNYMALHRDLKVGMTSAWQQATFHGPNGYYAIDLPSRQATLRAKTKILRQYYKYIRPGAVRIEATSTNPAMDPLAFINAGGGYVIVVKTDRPGTLSVEHLPPGLYSISYTTRQRFDVHLPDVTVAAGRALTANMPGTGVITIHAK